MEKTNLWEYSMSRAENCLENLKNTTGCTKALDVEHLNSHLKKLRELWAEVRSTDREEYAALINRVAVVHDTLSANAKDAQEELLKLEQRIPKRLQLSQVSYSTDPNALFQTGNQDNLGNNNTLADEAKGFESSSRKRMLSPSQNTILPSDFLYLNQLAILGDEVAEGKSHVPYFFLCIDQLRSFMLNQGCSDEFKRLS